MIGMDCGTTNIKAVLLGDDGVIAAEASRPSVTHSPGPGMREQDPNIWWEDAVGIFRELGRAAGPEEIAGVRGICVSSHTVSMLPVDETGTPLYNAFTYQDNRSVKELERILETVGFDNYVEIVGGQPAPSFLPSKLLWYREHEPERFAKTRTFLQASSFINFQLTGNMTIDLDQATRTQCLDLRTLDWSKEIGDAIGVNLHEVMPPIRQIYEEIGTVTPEAALVTGLPAGLGEPMFGGVESRIAQIVYGVPAVKAVDFGAGYSAAYMRGSQCNDAYTVENGDIRTLTNNSGGILGGITNGMPLIFQAAIKPTPSISIQQQSVSISQGEDRKLTVKGRHDPCIVPRAVPVIEAAAAIAIFDLILGNTQTDRRK